MAMLKNKKVIIIGALIAMVIIAGTIGGIALAQDEGTTSGNTTEPKTLMTRVAEILGINQQDLEAAVTQARNEMQLENVKNRLQNLVKEGRITQAQADEYLEWWQSKPDMEPYQQQLKEWMQSRPEVPSELKDWRQAKPDDVPLPGNFGCRGFRIMRGMMRGF
jgi:hypothetical protein